MKINSEIYAMKKFIPKKYQEQGIAFFLQKSFAGLFWPPGLGKTAVALHAWEILRKKKMVGPLFVISVDASVWVHSYNGRAKETNRSVRGER
jgi:superfamily II DNA or RNA helicase